MVAEPPKRKGFKREGGGEDDINIQFNSNVRGMNKTKTKGSRYEAIFIPALLNLT